MPNYHYEHEHSGCGREKSEREKKCDALWREDNICRGDLERRREYNETRFFTLLHQTMGEIRRYVLLSIYTKSKLLLCVSIINFHRIDG